MGQRSVEIDGHNKETIDFPEWIQAWIMGRNKCSCWLIYLNKMLIANINPTIIKQAKMREAGCKRMTSQNQPENRNHIAI